MGSVVGMAAATLAATVALAGQAAGSASGPPGTVSPFGGSVPVRIAHVAHIEVDLEPATTARLERVTCAGSRNGSACYVSEP